MLHILSNGKYARNWNLLHNVLLVREIHFKIITISFQKYFDFFDSQREVKVYFHKHGQFMDFSGRMGYYIYENERVQSQVHVQDLR